MQKQRKAKKSDTFSPRLPRWLKVNVDELIVDSPSGVGHSIIFGVLISFTLFLGFTGYWQLEGHSFPRLSDFRQPHFIAAGAYGGALFFGVCTVLVAGYRRSHIINRTNHTVTLTYRWLFLPFLQIPDIKIVGNEVTFRKETLRLPTKYGSQTVDHYLLTLPLAEYQLTILNLPNKSQALAVTKEINDFLGLKLKDESGG